MPDNYTAYHVHSDYSLLDSCTKFEAYVDKAVSLGQKAIAFTEHGNIFNWVKKKLYCKKNCIKYLHGVECYLTETLKEQVRDNYHTILIAKNLDGVREINSLVSLSNEPSHFYYKPRISFDEFLKISDNVITTSACLASPLNQLEVTHPYYDKLVRRYDYLEIQPHRAAEQVSYNEHLYALSKQYGKPLIAATDTHSLDKYKAVCRSVLQLSKHIQYAQEDTFDLTYRDYDTLVAEFLMQDSMIPKAEILKAIDNTNAMADSVEDFELDTSFKYPIMYGSHEKDAEMYKKRLAEKFADKVAKGIIPSCQVEAFKSALEEETRVFEKIDMLGFMLSMSEFVCWAKEHDIPVGFNRGSCGGSRVAYVLDITDMNPETWHTVFSRFANEDRKEIGDIDVDLPGDDRQAVYDYIIQRFGQDKTAYILAIGTVSSKGTIDEIGRALDIKYKQEHAAVKSPWSLDAVAKIKKEFEADEETAKKKYPELFYYYDGILNTSISQSMHPAGIVVSPITLADNYGTLIRDKLTIMQIDMEDIHEVSLVKYDILGLKNIGIIRDTYKLLGLPYPKSHEIDWNDKAVWDDMLKSPVGIFQFESPFAFQLLKQFKPRSIFDMSHVTAALRPAGASYRDDLMNHKEHHNPSALIDDLLKDNYGYLIYQEDVIKFLQQICGMSGSDADNLRRAIGRKDEERLNAALPAVLEGYCKKSDKPRAEAEKEAKQFLQIIEDASSYMFGYNHSIGYCLIGYLCAYLRYHHPCEFITAFLNNADKEEDISAGAALAKTYGITVSAPRYGLSQEHYVCNPDKRIIAKGISSIKYLNKAVSRELYDLYHAHPTDNFIDTLLAITQNTALKKNQLEILIKLDFFAQYGNTNALLRINEAFEYFKQGTAKILAKSKDNPYELLIYDYLTDKNDKGETLKTWKILDCIGLLKHYEKHVLSQNLPDATFKQKADWQMEYLGYIDLTSHKKEDRRRLYIEGVFPLISKQTGKPWGYRLAAKSIGSGVSSSLTVKADMYGREPIRKGDVVYASNVSKNNAGYWYLINYYIEL